MTRIFFVLFLTNLSLSAFSMDLYVFGDFGVNKSITQWSWARQFKPMHNQSLGIETHFGAERNAFLIGLKYNALFSKVTIGEHNETYFYKLSSGNGFGHISFYLAKSIYYKRRKKTANQIFIKSSIDYWNVIEKSYSSSLKSSTIPLGINWTSFNGDFDQNTLGAGLQIQYCKAFWSNKGRKYHLFGEVSFNFVKLPELGISWQVNNNAEQSKVSKHTPLQLNIGIAKRILKAKHAL